MTIILTTQLAVHFGNFRNVDLRKQGIYRVRTTVAWEHEYQEPQHQQKQQRNNNKSNSKSNSNSTNNTNSSHAYASRYSVSPFALLHANHENPILLRMMCDDELKKEFKHPGYLEANQNAYVSTSFDILYEEQEVLVDQGAVFRLRCPYFPMHISEHNKRSDVGIPSLSLVVTLERADIDDGENNQGIYKLEARNTTPIFEEVASRRYQVKRVDLGVHDFSCVIFDDICRVGFCSVDMTVHSCTVHVDSTAREGLTYANVFGSLLRHANGEKSEVFKTQPVRARKAIEHMERVRTRLLRPLLMSLRALVRFSQQLDDILVEFPIQMRPVDCADREHLEVELSLLGLRHTLIKESPKQVTKLKHMKSNASSNEGWTVINEQESATSSLNPDKSTKTVSALVSTVLLESTAALSNQKSSIDSDLVSATDGVGIKSGGNGGTSRRSSVSSTTSNIDAICASLIASNGISQEPPCTSQHIALDGLSVMARQAMASSQEGNTNSPRVVHEPADNTSPTSVKQKKQLSVRTSSSGIWEDPPKISPFSLHLRLKLTPLEFVQELQTEVRELTAIVMLAWHEECARIAMIGVKWGVVKQKPKWIARLRDHIERRVVVDTQMLDHHGLPMGALTRRERHEIAVKLREIAQTTELMLAVNTQACLVDEALVIDASSEPIVFEQFPDRLSLRRSMSRGDTDGSSEGVPSDGKKQKTRNLDESFRGVNTDESGPGERRDFDGSFKGVSTDRMSGSGKASNFDESSRGLGSGEMTMDGLSGYGDPMVKTPPVVPSREPFSRSGSVSSSGHVEPVVDGFQSPTKRKGVHLVVFVHGYMGNSWDLRTFRNQLSLLRPDLQHMMSSSNEECTEGDLRVMGTNLAREIVQHVKNNFGGPCGVGTLSFVGHSIGSIIIRTALTRKELLPFVGNENEDRKFAAGQPEAYNCKLGTMLSLSSPMLGSRFSESALVATGMWIFKRVRKSMALEQLAMTDTVHMRDAFLVQLSRIDKLHRFKLVVLMSSPQDKYVAHYSARLEAPPADKPTSNQQLSEELLAILEMRKNILGRMDSSGQLACVDLAFDYHQGSQNQLKNNGKASTRGGGGGRANTTSVLDRLIGRSAHISFLESSALTMMLLLHLHERLYSLDN